MQKNDVVKEMNSAKIQPSSYPGCQSFFLLFAVKIERRVLFPARHDRWFAAQFSPQTTEKKTSGTQGTYKGNKAGFHL